MSRKKREEARKRAEPPRPARKLPAVAVGAIAASAAIALAIGGYLAWRASSSSGKSRTVVVPDPVTTDFEVPVREIIAQARQGVLDAPDSANAWGLLATVLDAHRFFSYAEPAYRRALELAPEDPRFTYNLAILLESLGADENESLSLFRRFAQHEPKFPCVHVRIGKGLAAKGEMEAAAASYRTALALDPELKIARRALGQVLLALDDAAGAEVELKRVADAEPEDGPTQAALAVAYARLGDEARAAVAMRRGRELPDKLSLPDPVQFLVTQQGRSAHLASIRARGRAQSGDYAGVVEDLKIVLRTKNEDPRVHERIADAYQHLGQSALAAQHLAEARKLRGGH